MESIKKHSTYPDAPWIVLCHGYGADAGDLAPLADLMHLGQEVNWLFPQGILEVPLGPHFNGRAWFPIDMVAMQEAQMRGEHRRFRDIRPPGLDAARDQLQAMIEDLNVPWSKVILGGFSQGAMVTMDLALHLKESPKALVQLSGALVSQNEWEPLMANHKNMAVIQSHGRLDPVLSFEEATSLSELCQRQGLKHTFLPFDGGHEIPPPVLAAVRAFLKSEVEA